VAGRAGKKSCFFYFLFWGVQTQSLNFMDKGSGDLKLRKGWYGGIFLIFVISHGHNAKVLSYTGQ
jgi:hypothetical protein